MMRRISRLLTVLLLLLTAAGVVFSVRFLRREKELDAQRQSKVAELSEQLQPINEKRKELQEKEKEWQKTLEDGKTGTPCIMLCFGTMDEDLYDNVYDMMDQYGFRGTFVMRDARMPSYDEGNITGEEFAEMIDGGWEYMLAVGEEDIPHDSEEVLPWMENQSGETEEETEPEESTEQPDRRSFLQKLDDALAVYEEYQMERPVTLLCTTEQYEQTSDKKIADRGFQMVCLTGNEEFPVIGERGENLWVIDSGIYKQNDRSIESIIDDAVKKKQSLAITINDVVKNSENTSYDLSMMKFGSLLIKLKNLQEEGQIHILTFSEFYQYAQWQETEYRELNYQYADFREEMNRQIEELDRQEQDIVDSLRMTETQE